MTKETKPKKDDCGYCNGTGIGSPTGDKCGRCEGSGKAK